MNTMNGYLVHPAADAFPMMSDAELKDLAEDIRVNGLQTPVVLNHDESILIDGRNRLRACGMADVDLTYDTLPDDYTEEMILNYIVSANIHRRQMTQGQKAMVAMALEPMYAEVARKRQLTGKKDLLADQREGSKRQNWASERAAKGVGASGRSVSRAKAVKRDTPDLAEKVIKGEMSLDAADKERKKKSPSSAPNRKIKAEVVSIDWNTLPGNMKDKAEAMRRQVRRELEVELEPRVQAEVQERLEVEIKFMKRMQTESRRVLDSRKGIITRDDYDLIRSCLHPDSRESATNEKLAKAFRIFNEAEILFLNEKNHPTTRLPSLEDLLKKKKTS
jgi:ParB-like chromosome segregation protein Spo0J